MSITVEATYEDGVLKPGHPLPLEEREKVRVTVEQVTSRARQMAGMLRWSGDSETLRRLAEDSEYGLLESP